MSNRTEITLTASYQAISTKKAVFTVTKVPEGVKLYMNNANSDTAAMVFLPELEDQVVENEDQTIYAKGLGIVLLVDQEA
jgi:hypothetical protein